MLDNELKNYFESIEPDNELIERMIAVSNNSKRKKTAKLSKKIIALAAAVICIISAITVTAAVHRMHNDKNGIVSIQNTDDSFVLDFTKAQRTPDKLSNTNSDIVQAIQSQGINNVIIPGELINGGYVIDNSIGFLPQYTSCMFDFSDSKGNTVSLSIIQDIPDAEASGFWSTGDQNTIGEIVTVNGMDVIIAYMGDENIGFVSYIFYANENTIYQFSLSCGFDSEKVKEKTLQFVHSLAEQ